MACRAYVRAATRQAGRGEAHIGWTGGRPMEGDVAPPGRRDVARRTMGEHGSHCFCHCVVCSTASAACLGSAGSDC